jgi:hypothetical protein
MSDNRTIVDVFEEVLQVPFRAEHAAKVKPDVDMVRRLARSVSEHYEQFEIPEKPENELRPYLFHRYTTGATFLPDTLRPSMEHALKPYLLYSHGVAFLDPLPAFLDYFHYSSGPSTSYERDHLPEVERILQQYAAVADLIRHRVLIPISINESEPVYRLTEEEKKEVEEIVSKGLLSGNASPDFGITLASIVKSQLAFVRRSRNFVDLHFPTKDYVPLLRSLLKAARQPYSRADLQQPFDAGLLGSVSNIDVSKISIQDVLEVRKEGVFEDYRAVLRRAFERVHRNEGEFSSVEAEFSRAIRDELAESDSKIKEMTKKSNLLRDLISNADRILFGALAGTLGGLSVAQTPTAALVGAAAGGALRPTYDIIRGMLTSSTSGAARTSLRNHFLVMGPPHKK